jgi:hypothetical protein
MNASDIERALNQLRTEADQLLAKRRIAKQRANEANQAFREADEAYCRARDASDALFSYTLTQSNGETA